MTRQDSMQHILDVLERDADKAEQLISEHRGAYGESAETFLAEGKLHLKRSDWRQAQNAFLHARELRPDGPASQYLDMLADIMSFYNKDMFNQ